MLSKLANVKFVKSKLETVTKEKLPSEFPVGPKFFTRVKTAKHSCWTLYSGARPVDDELKEKLTFLKKKFTKKPPPNTSFKSWEGQIIVTYRNPDSVQAKAHKKSLSEYNSRRKRILARKPLISRGELNEKEYRKLKKAQRIAPQLVYKPSGEQQRIWMYKNAYYRDTDRLTQKQVAALLDTQISKTKKKVDLAVEMNTPTETSSTTKRETIPDDVKVFVWRRDEGQCIKCGSRENLEFDHIIPFSMGGSNTSRNLQLLCEPCNREKGGNLV